MPYPRTTLLPLSSTDGPTLTAAAAAEATPLPRKWWPSQQMTKDGTLYVTLAGRFTSTATPGTVIVDVRLAKAGVAFASAVTIMASATLTVLASQTNKTWQATFEIEVLSLGAGGAGIGQMRGTGRIFGITTAGLDLVPATAPMTAVNVDTTADEQLMVGLTPSVATGSWIVHSLDADYSGT